MNSLVFSASASFSESDFVSKKLNCLHWMVSLKGERHKVRLLATLQGVRELEVCGQWAADDLGGFNWGYFLLEEFTMKSLQESAYPIKYQIIRAAPLWRHPHSQQGYISTKRTSRHKSSRLFNGESSYEVGGPNFLLALFFWILMI